ncbi:MAG: hypothetical protein WC358_03055 [Ignavibacteria bacterium]|jgi:hypothetical protein
MKKIFYNIVIIFSPLFVLIDGCSSSNLEYKNHYRFNVIDSVLRKSNGKIYARLAGINKNEFIDYNILSFDYIIQEKNFKDTLYFFVISPKNIVIDTNYYISLIKGKSYDLYLEKIDTLIEARVTRSYDRGGGETRIIDPDLIYWENGKFMIKLYISKDINDVFIRKF